MSDYHLIPDHAQRTLDEQDAARAKARSGALQDQFRRTFISEYAQQIELIRRGAIVTEVNRAGEPVAFKMPDDKAVPTAKQARRTIWLSRVSRPFRNFFRPLITRVRKVWSWLLSANQS